MELKAGEITQQLPGFAACFALIFLSLSAGPAHAQEPVIVIDTIRVQDGNLQLDYHVDSLLTGRLLTGMKRGMTSSARFRVQLWRKRGWFLGALLAEQEYEVKATYDPWEEKFILKTEDERRLTSSLDLVRQTWQQHRNITLADSSRLNPKYRYYVALEVLLEPVSRETLREIRGWLAGEVKSLARSDSTNSTTPEQKRGFRDRVLDLVVDLTGLGERVTSIKSGTFRVREGGQVVFEK